MARLRRDAFAWCSGLPGATLMIVCLFLPQLRECNGRVRTPFQTGCAPLMIVVASLGVLPALWPLLRIAPRRLWLGLTSEEMTATVACLGALAFVAVFPFLSMYGTWLVGGELAWAAGWAELASLVAWSSAASDRAVYSSTVTTPVLGVLIHGVASGVHERICSSYE